MLKQIIQMFLGDEIQKEFPGKELPLEDADPSGYKPPAHVIFYSRNHTLLSRKQLRRNGGEHVMLNVLKHRTQCLVHFEAGADENEPATLW